MRKILVATGGTGGHTFVAIALARELNRFGFDTVFTTTKNSKGMEGWRRYNIHAGGFLGKSIRGKLINSLLFTISILESLLIVLKERPQAVLGTGSYPSVAPALASRLYLVPLFITEIDSLPGLATRLLSLFASRVYLCYEDAQRYLPKGKTGVFGCPVRDLNIVETTVAKERLGFKKDLPLILVFGGSGGAKRINSLMVDIAPQLEGIQFLLSTGIRDYIEISNSLKYCKRVKAYPFIEDMGVAYSAADLVICRAGALTLAEIVRFKKPALVIPFPYATQQHQYMNAKKLEELGCIRLIPEKMISPDRLKGEIEGLMAEEYQRRDMIKGFPEINNGAKIISEDIARCLGI